jgi:hypothetical protein
MIKPFPDLGFDTQDFSSVILQAQAFKAFSLFRPGVSSHG